MAYTYTTLTDDAKHSLISRRIREMEQEHFHQGLTAIMLDTETAPEAKAMAADARKTQAALERGIGEAVKLRKVLPTPAPPTLPPAPTTPPKP